MKFLSVVNLDTVNAEVTIQINNAATLWSIFVVTLAADEQLVYTDNGGFRVYDNSGVIQ